MVPGDPGVIATPASAALRRAAALSPMTAIASAGGPMNTMPASWPRHLLLHDDQRLPAFDRLRIVDQDVRDRAACTRRDRVHQLHHLDDADDGMVIDDLPDIDEGAPPGFGRAIERAHHRRTDD